MEVFLELCQPFLFLAQTVDHGGRQIDRGEESHRRSIRFEGAVSVARLADIVGYQSDCYGGRPESFRNLSAAAVHRLAVPDCG